MWSNFYMNSLVPQLNNAISELSKGKETIEQNRALRFLECFQLIGFQFLNTCCIVYGNLAIYSVQSVQSLSRVRLFVTP